MIDLTLYAITDRTYSRGRSLEEAVGCLLNGGATVVQLRDKGSPARSLLEEAKVCRSLTREFGIPLIVNDRIDVALASDADGVHLGQEDLPCSEARKLLGLDRIIGISVHSLDEAKEAEQEGASYLSVGKVYPTKTKVSGRVVGLSVLREIAEGIPLPVIAIGGIDLGNVKEVLQAGASGVAVIRGLLDADDVRERAQALRQRIDRWRGSRS